MTASCPAGATTVPRLCKLAVNWQTTARSRPSSARALMRILIPHAAPRDQVPARRSSHQAHGLDGAARSRTATIDASHRSCAAPTTTHVQAE